MNDSESVADRIGRVVGLVDAAMRGADFVVLPELWPAGAFDLPLGIEHSEPLDGPTMTKLADVAESNRTWLHAGSFVERSGDDLYNTSVVFSPDGELKASYRKIHLFGFDSGEAALISAGDQLALVETPLGLTGLATCYDLRFPELFRMYSAAGAATVIVSAGWPLARLSAWELLIPARALENQCYVVGCSAAGTHAQVQLAGRSMISDPYGNLIAEGSTEEDTITADIEPVRVEEFRRAFPTGRDRKLTVHLPATQRSTSPSS